MKIVVPISSSDTHLLDDFVALFRALGGAPRQDVYLLPTRGVTSEARIACEAMQARCRKCEVITWDKDNAEVQPIAGNFMWKHAVTEMGLQENKGDRQPWYFMELDNTILKAGWADALESEYAMSGCLFMGASAPSRFRLEDGTITTDVHIPGHPPNIPFMVGTGIYPVAVPKWTKGQWAYAKYESWDKFLKFYTARSLHVTKLIQHRWKTCNYRRDGDQIICDNDPKNPDKTDNAGPVDPNAMILHGCKDGSLMRIVLESLHGGAGMNMSVGYAAEAPPPSSPPQDAKVQSTKSSQKHVEYDNATWDAFKRKVMENHPEAQAPITPDKPTIAPEAQPVVEKEYQKPDETGQSGIETREGKSPDSKSTKRKPSKRGRPKKVLVRKTLAIA